MSDQTPLHLTRRGLIATAGAVGAATALTRVPAAAAAPTRVGVLVPTGLLYSRAGDSLLAGLRLGARAGGLRLDIRTADVDRGHVGASGAAAALAEGGAQVVVAGVSSLAAVRVAPVLEEAGSALVVANVGAHIVTDGQGAIHTSLQHWQSALSMGGWSARHLGNRLFMVIAAPDAGYDSVFALRRGFTGSGGTVVGQAFTHGATRGTRAAAQAAKASGAEVVAVCASGERVAQIVQGLRAAGVRARIVVDAVGLEPFALNGLKGSARGIYSVASWTGTDQTRRNREFVSAYRQSQGRRPDAFSALGYDTGLLLAAGSDRLPGRGRDWSHLSSALAGQAVAGVRGVQRVHARLGTVSTPLSVRRVARKDGGPTPVTIGRRDRVGGVAPALQALARAETTAYVNEYLGA